MIALGIEGTAHTLGIGIIDSKGKVMSDVRSVYSPKAGIHPRESSRHMSETIGSTLKDAFEKAGLEMNDIDIVAFSQGPGLGPCLRTAATASRALAMHYEKPLIGVNHCVAHIEIGKLESRLKNPLTLYVSGGNSQVLMLKDGRYRIFGETLDIGIGNMLDKFGRETGLAHPAGPKIEKLALEGKNYLPLPYVVKGTDLSFSGLTTSAISLVNQKKATMEDVCYSLQETSFAMLTEVTERALAHLKSTEVLLTGGVGNNSRLQEMVQLMCDEQGAKFGVPKGLCSDNGVMIAWTGLVMHEAGVRQNVEDTAAIQNFRTDQVDVVW